MAHDVVVSPVARDDMERAASYFEDHNPGSVSHFLSRLERGFALVAAHPYMGPPVAAVTFPDMRKATVEPYVVYYRIAPTRIEIVRVLHHAQQDERDKL